MSTLSERLKELRKAKGLTQQQLGDLLQVSKQAIANIEVGHNNPSLDFICKLIENLNVNSNWLITGNGEMFNGQNAQDEITKAIEKTIERVVEEKLKGR